MISLTIWLPRTSLAEGNYRDFRSGQEVRFPLEFHPKAIVPTAPARPALEPTEPGFYRFSGPLIYQHEGTARSNNGLGEVIASTEAFCVFDAGVLGYCLDSNHYRLPATIQEGSWWAGQASLCVGWHFFERYSALPGLPPMVYPWKVRRILEDRTPRATLIDAHGHEYLGRDSARELLVAIDETDWRARPESDYLIECAQLGPPTRDRLDVATPEQERVMRSLSGAELLVKSVQAGRQTAVLPVEPIAATLLQLSDETPRFQRGLLRFHSPPPHAPSAFPYAVALPRYEGGGIGQLATAGRYSCWLKLLPSDCALSNTPFDHHQWPTGGVLPAELEKLQT